MKVYRRHRQERFSYSVLQSIEQRYGISLRLYSYYNEELDCVEDIVESVAIGSVSPLPISDGLAFLLDIELAKYLTVYARG